MSIITEALKKAGASAKKKIAEEKPRAIALEIKENRPGKPRRRSPRALFIPIGAVIALLFVLFYGLFFVSPKKAEPPPPPLPQTIESVAPPAPLEEIAKVTPPAFSIENEVQSSVRLTGIMYAPDHPLAVINDGIWSENEYIGKLRIAEIGKDFVKFEKDGAEFTVNLKR